MVATETRIITKRLRERPDDSWTIDAALATGCYEGLRKAFTIGPAGIGAEQVKASGLRGRGGAGFPTATKWSFLPPDSYPRYLVVNADEGEPSTFKDHMLLEQDPHQMIEGIVIAAFAIECNLAFVYIRGEFALGYERLESAIAEAHERGYLGTNILGSGFDLDIVVHRGAGAYICGEETALLESLEGERGMPRIRPPFPAVEGLYAKPTVVNNVETLSTLPHIILMGGDKYAELGVNKSTGTRLFSVSGHVNRPGNYEVELGITFRDLLESPELGGGIRDGRKVKFVIPGGASSQWLTGSDEHLDAPLDMDYVQQTFGVMLGSGAVMVFDETTNPALVAWRLAKFFAHESCGKCTPCREGTGWIEKVLYRISHGEGRPDDLDMLLDVGDNICPGLNAPFTQTTICPLGPSAVSPVVSLNKYFRDEVMAMCRARGPGMSDNAMSEMVNITIDGREVEVPKGEWLIKAAQEHGTYIPRFCWHERMKPVGMCRMCLVEVEGVRGLPPACTTPVTDGMVVSTRSPAVKKAQDGVLEFFLINHPLDCPVCDRGGECPLQDTTLAFGPGESRFIEEKRHWEKPIPVSDLVLLDRERCIQCARCYRFADEIAGDPLITFGERGEYTEIVTFPDDPFASYFSGNTVQICPVGALTAKPYRFKARPWDLSGIETSCTTCAVHCRGALESTSNRLVRLLGVDSEPVNQGWLCDKGRFGYEAVHSDGRIRSPMIRKTTDGPDGPSSELVECSWPEALDAAADGLRRALDLNGPQSVAVLGGARCTNEDAYVWARFAKGVLRTDNTDAQLGDGLPAELALGLPHATIPSLDNAAAIVLLGPDLKEELPVLYLRVRRAAQELGVPVIEISPTDTGLTRYAKASLRHAPGEQGGLARKLAAAIGGSPSGDEGVDAAAALIEGRDGDIVVIVGRGQLAESADYCVDAAGALAELERSKFLVALRRGNVRGALDLGLTPGFLPGRVTLEDGRAWFEQLWGGVPDVPGLDAAGILSAAEQGRVHALVLLGSDPARDFPDRTLARKAVDGAGFVIAVDAFLTESTRRADVFLPIALWGEKPGSVTNIEGRVQRVGRKISPDGTVMPDWRVAAELAYRMGVDFDLETAEEVQDEIAIVSPVHEGVDSMLLRRARDGVVLPRAEHEEEIVLGRLSMRLTDASWEPITPQPEELEPEELAAIEETLAVADATADPAEPDAAEPDAAEPDAAESVVAESVVAAQTAERPATHTWSGPSSTPAEIARDAYALRLVAGRRLYDVGTTVVESPSLAPLAPRAELLVNGRDREAVGVEDGSEVRVTSSRGSVTLPIRADDRIPAGSASLTFNLAGSGSADLIDVNEGVTDLRVESVR